MNKVIFTTLTVLLAVIGSSLQAAELRPLRPDQVKTKSAEQAPPGQPTGALTSSREISVGLAHMIPHRFMMLPSIRPIRSIRLRNLSVMGSTSLLMVNKTNSRGKKWVQYTPPVSI